MLTALRKNQQQTTTRFVALLALVWLNMALNPCAMALGEPEEHDCPHCPEAQHCDEEVVERCTYIDSIDSDGRTHHSRIPDYSDYVFILPTVLVPVPELAADRSAINEFYLHATGPPGPPLYVRHCAYLN